jgi:uncharacterized protein DUF6923
MSRILLTPVKGLGSLVPIRWIAVSALAAFTIGCSHSPTAPSHKTETMTLIYAMGERATALVSIDPQTGVGHVVGPTGYSTASKPLASDATGQLYTIVNSDTEAAQLARLDRASGAATLVGQPMGVKLNIMGMAFSPEGVLYGGGDVSPASPTFNSLYTIDLTTGRARQIGQMGADLFVMALAFRADGALYGQSTSTIYRIDPLTGRATPAVSISGAPSVMGMTFESSGTLFATNWVQDPMLYRLDLASGNATTIGPIGSPFVHSIALVKVPR